jgi:uncharacterized membrane protein YbhN (UPF0104 family)
MRWARAAIGLTLLALVLWKASAQSVWRSLSTLDGRLFALAALLYGACQLLSSLRWGLILRPLGVPVRPRRLFALYLVGMFFNQLLPGSIGGDVVKMVALARGAAGGVSVVLDRLVGLAALLVLAAAAALFGTRVDPRLGALGAAVLLAAAIAFAALRVSAGRSRIAQVVKALPPRALAAPLAVGATVQVLNAAVYLILASALALPAPLSLVVALYIAVTLAAAAPISLGGLGVREVMGAFVFQQAGFPPAQAVALALAWTASDTLWALCGGALFALLPSLREPARP